MRNHITLQLHARPPPGGTLQDRTVKDYSTYKKVILFFALVDGLYTHTLSGVSAVPSNEAEWPSALAEWIRSNDDALLKASARVLNSFQVCSPELIGGLKLGNVCVFVQLICGQQGPQISCTKTQTLPNLRLSISSVVHTAQCLSAEGLISE